MIATVDTSDVPFDGIVEEFDLGSVKLWRLSSEPAESPLDAALMQLQEPEHLQVMLQTGERPVVAEPDGAADAEAADDEDEEGGIVAWSSSWPYPVDLHAVGSGLILACPLASLGPQADRVPRETVRRFDDTCGPGLVLRQCLLAMQSALEQDALTGCEVSMGEAALDLVRALYVPAADAELSTAGLRKQVMEYVDAHLGEPALGAVSIARALFVSRSHLDRVFQAEGTTVTRWIRHRRLERCRTDLLDPGSAHESIFAIAARWGFVSHAHFCRTFRVAYGCSPREMRQRAA